MTVGLLLFLAALAWAGGQGGAMAAEEKVTIHMFMGNSGVPHPADMDPSDNWAIDIVERIANVDLILEVPNYQEWATKHQLLLASGNLPDIVHAQSRGDQEVAAMAGAFVDLAPYYDKSPVMQQRVSQLAFDLAALPDGLHFAIPMVMSDREPGWGNILRYDLLEEYNGGKYPENIEGYLDFFRWIKKTWPDSLPLSSRFGWGGQLFVTGNTLFVWYGVAPYGTRIQDGKVMHNFTVPAMKDALKLWQEVFKEGLLDPEFATSTGAEYGQKKAEKRVAMFTNDTDQLLPGYDGAMKDGIIWRWTPKLKEYPAALTDVKYTYGGDVFPIAGHRTSIAASSQHKDRAWKVLEAFASDEFYDAEAWGREGKEYNIVDGKRVPTDKLYFRDLEDPDAHYWTLHLGIINGFWPTKVKYAVQRTRNPEAFEAAYQSTRYLVQAAKDIGLGFGSFIPPNEEVSKKSGEINPFISGVIAKVIMGQMSLDEFDDEVAKFNKEFGFIYDFQTKYVQDHRDELRTKNVKMVDW